MDDHKKPRRYQHGPDPLPFTSGNDLTPFQHPHNPQAVPQRTSTIVVATLGLLLLIALVIWFLSLPAAGPLGHPAIRAKGWPPTGH